MFYLLTSHPRSLNLEPKAAFSSARKMIAHEIKIKVKKKKSAIELDPFNFFPLNKNKFSRLVVARGWGKRDSGVTVNEYGCKYG